MASNEHPIAIAKRREKVFAMVAVIDRNFIKQHPTVDPYDQAGRIWQASVSWNDKVWLQIAKSAGYKSDRTPGPETRTLVREIYEGRSKAPLASREAS
jgi:hypothetical protein